MIQRDLSKDSDSRKKHTLKFGINQGSIETRKLSKTTKSASTKKQLAAIREKANSNLKDYAELPK